MSDQKPLVRVAVGVAIFKDGKVLLGKRKGKHAPGVWAFTGGHIEFGETAAEAAVRETIEESGLRDFFHRIALGQA